MAQATFSVRMDFDLKKEFDRLCAEFGMTATTAINVFAKAVVREKKIPFEIVSNERAAYNERLSRFYELYYNMQHENVAEDVVEYNAETLSAIEEGRKLAQDSKAKKYKSVEELRKALDL